MIEADPTVDVLRDAILEGRAEAAELLDRVLARHAADLRTSFEAGYRWGYRNGHCDGANIEPFDAEPGEAFDLWTDPNDTGLAF